MLISPQQYELPCMQSELCTNNVGKYNTLLIGMKIAHELSVQHLEAYNDLILIVNQVRSEFEVHNEDLVSYYAATTKISYSRLFSTLASLATSLALQPGALVLTHDLYCPKSAIEEVRAQTADIQDKGKETFDTSADLELKDWRFPYIDFNLFRILPDATKMVAAIIRKAPSLLL